MTYNEWIKSIIAGDGKKWTLEEGPDGSTIYFETPVGQAQLQKGEGPMAKRNRKAREQYKKRTGKEPKPYAWKLGYNHCVGQYQTDDDYARLSGSSLNRSLKKKREKARLFIQVPKKIEFQEPHLFSKRSRGKVKDKATAFWRATSGKRAFVTLTFIEHIPDLLGVQILNKFLTVLRKEKAGLQYLWVAEPQEENHNRIHFHMLVNRRLDIKRYNALWTLQQYNAGLIGHKDSGEIITKAEIEQRYQYDMNSEFRKKDPDSVMAVLNPFSIEKAYNIYGLANYLTTYITKQAKDHEFGCLPWHCSRKVSKLFVKEVVSPSTFRYMCSFGNFRVDTRTGEVLQEPEPIVQPFFTMVYVLNKGAPLKFVRQLEQVNKWIIGEFEPDKLPMLNDILYRKILINAEEKYTAAFPTDRRVQGLSNTGGGKGRVKISAVQTFHQRRKKLEDKNNK